MYIEISTYFSSVIISLINGLTHPKIPLPSGYFSGTITGLSCYLVGHYCLTECFGYSQEYYKQDTDLDCWAKISMCRCLALNNNKSVATIVTSHMVKTQSHIMCWRYIVDSNYFIAIKFRNICLNEYKDVYSLQMHMQQKKGYLSQNKWNKPISFWI